jgi:hypothetical protein
MALQGSALGFLAAEAIQMSANDHGIGLLLSCDPNVPMASQSQGSDRMNGEVGSRCRKWF